MPASPRHAGEFGGLDSSLQKQRNRHGNPQLVAGDLVFAWKTQNTSLGISSILVFWYSGLALVKMRFLCWRVAFLYEKPRIPAWAQVVFWSGTAKNAV
jgi:hypothetical protein